MASISRVDLPDRNEALDFNCARVLRPRERGGVLPLIVFIIIVGGTFFHLVIKAGCNLWRASTVMLGGKLRLTRHGAIASRLLKVSVLDQPKFVLANLIIRALCRLRLRLGR